MTSSRTFTVMVYADFHKRVEIEILRSFTNSADALEFAHTYYAESKRKEKAYRRKEAEIDRKERESERKAEGGGDDEADDGDEVVSDDDEYADYGGSFVIVNDAIYDMGLPSPYKDFILPRLAVVRETALE